MFFSARLCEFLRKDIYIGVSRFKSNICKSFTSSKIRKMRLGNVDPSSYSEPEKVFTKNIHLNWTIDFQKHVIKGSATYLFDIIEKNISSILLDVKDINVCEANILISEKKIPIQFYTTDNVDDIGAKLTLSLPEGTVGTLKVCINYETSAHASALQWLSPEQTLGKKHPYLFSQCQAIHARSLLPCQDTPAVKFTYTAVVTYPKDLTALMSAICLKNSVGVAEFEQTIPIPSYLLAIAVGDLVSKPLGNNCNVWGEPGIIDKSAEEFSETAKFVQIAADICGPYVWKQYDLLVMPPSFPYGGMENPCLTFVTPTLLAGDKSLADVVAHEIAHSWTGNLVTNKNFEHFWLNEGFTVFVEAKIVGRLRGPKDRDFHSIRNLTELAENIRTQLSKTPELTKLVVDLSNCGPDDAFSSVPYIKGSTFLRYLEDKLGGPDIFEPFLKFYLNKYKFRSVTTDDFKSTLYDYFLKSTTFAELNDIDWDKWLYGEGMPPQLPKLDDSLAVISKNLSILWSTKTVDEIKNAPERLESLSSHQLIDFLAKLIECGNIVDLNEQKIELLESTYKLKANNNSEVKFRFVRLCIRAKLLNRLPEIFECANSNFRMKFVRPIYRDLGQWPEAKSQAIENFKSVKNEMMQVCWSNVEKDLGLK